MLDTRVKEQKTTAIRNFTDLLVWQSAYKLSLAVYKITSKFPREENFGLTSQMRRSSVSVASNLAEGFGRSTKKDKEHFYQMASGSLYELKSQVLIAKGLDYLVNQEYEQLQELADNTHKLLHGLLRSHRANNIPNIQHLTSNI